MRIKMRPFLSSVLVGTCVLLVNFNGCSGFKTSEKSSAHSSSAGGGSNANPTLALSVDQPALAAELATSKVVKLSLVSVDGFSGPVDVKIVSPEIDALDLKDGVQILVSQSSVTVAAGGTATVDITIDVGTLAPTIPAEHFHIETYKGGTQLLIEEAQVDLSVVAIFRLKVHGVGNAKWEVNGLSMTDIFAAAQPVFNFVHHPEGLQVIFENYDTVARRIHSGGAIAHQQNDIPASADAGVTAGGNYSPAAIVGNQPSNASVYLHNGETNANARRLNFNTDL